MKHVLPTLLLLAAALPAIGQAIASPGISQPDSASAVYGATAPLYDYSTLKPWHIKASYQLYDDAGNPAEQGTYEQWWASPKLYRSSWTRPGASYTEWRTADGSVAYQAAGEPITYFEHKLQTAFLSPVNTFGSLDPARLHLDEHGLSAPHSVAACYRTLPAGVKEGPPPGRAPEVLPVYCFNTRLQLLLGMYLFGDQAVKFYNTAKFEGRNIPRGVDFQEGARQFLLAEAELPSALDASDPALTPPATAKRRSAEPVPVAASVAQSLLTKKPALVYPQDAKDAHLEGKVEFEATIGPDGRVSNLLLLSAPGASLARSAFWYVSQFHYKPSLVDGQPVAVKTTVTVNFTLTK